MAKKGKNATGPSTTPAAGEGGQGVPGLPVAPANAEAATGPEPESPKEGTQAEPSATAKTDKLPERGNAPGAKVGTANSKVPTPEGHPDTLTDEQKEYIHKEREAAKVNALKEVTKRVTEAHNKGYRNCAVPCSIMEVHGVQAELTRLGYTAERGHDPKNWELGFPAKKTKG